MKKRNTGINLFKLFSMFMIALLHVLGMGGITGAAAGTSSYYSVYLMQNAGADITLGTLIVWILISTLAAVGNAGVPMGCFFLSASLLAGMNVPILLMGVILPFYAVVDAIETALNVWSDSCVAAMVDHDLKDETFDA